MSHLPDKLTAAKVSDLMLSSAAVSCSPETSIAEVVKRLRQAEIGCIVVVTNNRPVGIFSERDYLKKIACNQIDKDGPISDFMTPNPVCVTPQDSIGRVLIKMRMGRFRHIVVTESDGRLKNVISIKDILDHLLDTLTDTNL